MNLLKIGEFDNRENYKIVQNKSPTSFDYNKNL